MLLPSRPAILLRNVLLKKYPLFEGCGSCGEDTIPPLRHRLSSAPEPDFPLDFVFTWVDGDDPALAARRAAFLSPHAEPAQELRGASLYRDNDELRYALRSVNLYAPWARRIFLVTDRQVPAWLNREHPGLQVVDHSECIPPASLPTFSSNVIEAHLHRIPGLAEHYVYFNDDFFLTAPCVPGDFFTSNGLPHVFIDWRQSRREGFARHASMHAVSHASVRRLLEQGGISPAPDFIAAHAPYPQTQRNALDAYEFFQETIQGLKRFRAIGEIAFNCHASPLLAYARKRTVPCDIRYYYLNAKRFDRRTWYDVVLREKNKGSLPLFFCINDVGDAPPGNTWREDMAAFLAAMYPEPSPFEKAPPPSAAFASSNSTRIK